MTRSSGLADSGGQTVRPLADKLGIAVLVKNCSSFLVCNYNSFCGPDRTLWLAGFSPQVCLLAQPNAEQDMTGHRGSDLSIIR